MNSPFVYLYSDGRTALQILARGKNGVVWLAIGMLYPTSYPNGVSKSDILRETGLSADTVDAALTSLTVSKLVVDSGGNFAPSHYIEYRKAQKKFFSEAKTELASSSSDCSVQPKSKEKNKTNFYALYSEVFKELASSRTTQADEQVESVGEFPSEWVREAFRRTSEREMADIDAGNGVWWQTRRVSYALRILDDWQRRGEMKAKRETKPAKGAPSVLEITL